MYLHRLEKLEAVGASFPGVEKCHALQAGREIRILVEPSLVTADGAVHLAREIRRKIEDELQYPGQIKVTVVRETRSVEYAKSPAAGWSGSCRRSLLKFSTRSPWHWMDCR